MSEATMKQMRAHYEALAQALSDTPRWRAYCVDMALALYGADRASAAAYIQTCVKQSAYAFSEAVGSAPGQGSRTPQWRAHQIQLQHCLPLIEQERCTYIMQEHDRMQMNMNVAYWDREEKNYKIFHPLPELNVALDQVGDPYDLSLAELALMPTLTKRIDRVGATSYLCLFPMYPEEKARITFLSQVYEALTHAKLLTPAQVSELFDGHEAFLDFKLADTVQVIE